MNWFKRHLNWTYLLSIIFAFFVAFTIEVISGFTSIIPDTSDPSYGLHIYLDKNYTRLWSATDVPDLNNMPWTAPDSSGWQTATLIVYLENRGSNTLEVNVLATEDPRFARPGFSVSSDIVVLNPNERSPIVIKISQSPAVLAALSSDIGMDIIYWHMKPVPQVGNDTLAIWVSIAIMVGVAGWVLHQKGRSYGWLLLSLSGIGIIIILCLENKRLISEPEIDRDVYQPH